MTLKVTHYEVKLFSPYSRYQLAGTGDLGLVVGIILLSVREMNSVIISCIDGKVILHGSRARNEARQFLCLALSNLLRNLTIFVIDQPVES